MLHNILAVTTQGIPLELYDQQFIERQKFHGPNPRKIRYWNNHIHRKESYSWIRTVEKFHSLEIYKNRLIQVADREGDIYELYRDCVEIKENLL